MAEEEKKKSFMEAWGGLIFAIFVVLGLAFTYFKYIKGTSNDMV